ncbi:hypothetical protein [Moheibacter lacus]|uniref:Glycosaminoglycan attachment protein n=1 Tax=Moheibacter lacus TaxID=2745851 RepID=A0A838ZTL7_9FLAO|nr:hypothetical protein [Moheibacter lacus]MBA5630334.1 hypothetical protein [Moheibacter lacus]
MRKIKEIEVFEINRNRFNIYMLFTRHPYTNFIAQEVGYYSNENNSILGVLLFDYEDEDFNYTLMARDENKQFRAFEVQHSFKTKEEAISTLKNSIKWHTAQNVRVVVQGASKKGLDLFKIIVDKRKLHPYFIRLNNDIALKASKNAIIEISNHLDDIDGNFIEQFQSINGFDARIWEIYLFASLIESHFEIIRGYNRPDFLVKKNEVEIGIEAVIVDRKNNPPRYLLHDVDAATPAQIKEKLENEMPLRFGSALYSKLNKEYWKLKHLKDKPLIFAIADFHDNASMTWSFTALVEYLYGKRDVVLINEDGSEKIEIINVDHYTKETGAKIPAGFFLQENSENVSGILFSSTGTLGKFTRMGIEAGFREKGQILIRVGDRYDLESDSFIPVSFMYTVNEDGDETWSQGLNLFHNPNAKFPIDVDLFPNIAHHKQEGNELVSWVPEFHPFSSININTVPQE